MEASPWAIRTALTFNFCNIALKETIINSHIIPLSIKTIESVMCHIDSTNHNSGTHSTGVVDELTVSYNYIVVTYSKCTTIFACSITINKLTVIKHLRFFNKSNGSIVHTRYIGVISMYINCKPSRSNIDKITII